MKFRGLESQFERLRKNLLKRVDGFDSKVARVGILESSRYPDGQKVAYIGSIHEYGAPMASIPPRPFIGPTVSGKKEEWVKSLGMDLADSILTRGGVDGALERVGMLAAGDIKRTIADLVSPPLSPITIMLRGMRDNARRRGYIMNVTGKTVGEAAKRVSDGKTNYGADDKPLVDLGYLIGSIQNDVVSK